MKLFRLEVHVHAVVTKLFLLLKLHQTKGLHMGPGNYDFLIPYSLGSDH